MVAIAPFAEERVNAIDEVREHPNVLCSFNCRQAFEVAPAEAAFLRRTKPLDGPNIPFPALEALNNPVSKSDHFLGMSEAGAILAPHPDNRD